MSKANPLGLLVTYGESDDDSDDGVPKSSKRNSDSSSRVPLSYSRLDAASHQPPSGPAGVHPAPIPHCPWSACYDENSGFTYYWNQHTNAVTWEAPPEYLLALKLAQQQLHTLGSAEVSAEEWQLYQQALAEKQTTQNKALAKATILKSSKKPEKPSVMKDKNVKTAKKRRVSDDEDEKIELITSYHNSDSDSNDETEKPLTSKTIVPKPPVNKPKVPPKKPKTKPPQEYGPSLPPNQNYSMPIGPELPPELVVEKSKSPDPQGKEETEDAKSTPKSSDEDSDESSLLKRLKDKAKLLEKLGGELPSELQKIINDETKSLDASPKTDKDSNSLDIDNLLEEIEKKELPKIKSVGKEVKDTKSNTNSGNNTPSGDRTPPLEELKALYPDSELIINVPSGLFPSAMNIDENSIVKPVSVNVDENKADSKPGTPPPEKEKEKKENVYLMDSSEVIGNATRKKLRISNSVLPERKKIEKVETPAYTTKYSQFIEGFSSERTGLGFSKHENVPETPKTTNNTVSYGNGLQFTKGETLNEEKKEEDLDDMTELLEAKLNYLNQLQPGQIAPVQEMFVQMQTLSAAYIAGALRAAYWRQWSARAMDALARHEAAAAPPGWRATFTRSEGRYCYRRETDGLLQWEYPASTSMDMDICTTPPLPETDAKEERAPAAAAPAPAPPLPKPWSRATPPPPGTEAPTPSPPPIEPKKEIGDELASFYSDIAQLERVPDPPTLPSSPEPPPPPPPPTIMETDIKNAKKKSKDASCDVPPPPPSIKEKDIKNAKKKSKMKISTSLSMKNKSVSSLVAKWQQVADEINSD